jgi:hypothetical protein
VARKAEELNFLAIHLNIFPVAVLKLFEIREILAYRLFPGLFVGQMLQKLIF